MNRIVLSGCTPEPLLRYLKGLGIFRLLALGPDPGVRADWSGDRLTLTTQLDRDGLVAFFLREYRPTPVVAPWNGGSGFWDSKAAGQAVKQVETSTTPRLEPYRQAIAVARATAGRLHISKQTLQKDKQAKSQFLRELRSVMPDEALEWLDATTVIADEAARFAPVLGTGGNDGNLDYSANFMQRLADVLLLQEGGKRKGGEGRSQAWLEDALFAEGRPALADAALGQYHPGGVGGPNATSGFEGASLVNPWDYILMVEGLLVLAGATARRLGSDSRARAAFPFTVSTTAAGMGTLTDQEEASSRAEIWLPLWQNPASFADVQRLFSEGRAQVGRRQARTGLDFARAVAGLGVDRGIEAFQRYGFMQRNGLAYLAVPLGRLHVQEQPRVRLLDEAEVWIAQFQRLAGEQETGTLKAAANRIERACFAYCEFGGADRLQEVLSALGQAERCLALAPKFHEAIRPLSALSTGWIDACDDGSATFRIAVALASIYDEKVGSLREQLEPVVRQPTGYYAWAGEGSSLVAGGGDLCRTLGAILERRLLEADREGAIPAPVRGRTRVTLADVQHFLTTPGEDQRLFDLLVGLTTLLWDRWQGEKPRLGAGPATPPDLNRTYAVLKLLFMPDDLPGTGDAEPTRIRPEPAIIHRLRSQQVDQAMAVGYRRLWASGLTPLGLRGRQHHDPPAFLHDPAESGRLAAALLIPITGPRPLMDKVLRPAQSREGKGSL